jgi:hypothetical protein
MTALEGVAATVASTAHVATAVKSLRCTGEPPEFWFRPARNPLWRRASSRNNAERMANLAQRGSTRVLAVLAYRRI